MLLDLVELFSNRTLAYDAATQTRLERLRGKTMLLTVKPMNQSLAVTPQKKGLEFSPTIPSTVDVTLRVTLGALLKISRDGFENAELAPGELEIVGDPIIGQRFAMVLAELNIDWDSLLRDQFGEAPAQVIQFAAGQARDFFGTTRAHLKQFTSRLLTQDLGLVAKREEVAEVLDQIDDLRADSDRLMTRIDRVRRKLDMAATL